MNRTHLLLVLALAIIVPLQMGAGCESTGGGYDSDGHDNNHSYDNDDRPGRIPHYADNVRQGTGKLKWTADLDGTFYVYDRDKDHIAYTGRVRRGQEIVVQPGDDRITVAQNIVFQENLRRDGFYQLYFAREDHGNSPDQHAPHGEELPRDAREMAHGRGDLAINESPHGGRVYVYDATDRRVLYSSEIGKGNSFQIFPEHDVINLNSKRAANVNFPSGHQFTLYLSN